MLRPRFAVLVAAWACLAQDAASRPVAEPPILAGYAAQAWSVADGLPHDSITSIVLARDEFLWFGTLDGLARFDGHAFRLYNLIRSAGIDSNAVTALAEDRDGAMWIGTTNGVLRLFRGQFLVIEAPPGTPRTFVRAILTRRDGSVWIGTDARSAGENRGPRISRSARVIVE